MATWYYLQRAMLNKIKSAEFDYRTHFATTQVHVEANTDLNSKCRVCLQISTVQIYNDDNSESVIDVLQLVTGEIINEHDDKPKALCKVCYDFIKTIVIFRKIAKQTQDILKQPLKIENYHLVDDEVNHTDHNYTVDIFDTKPPGKEWLRIPDNVLHQEKKKHSSKVTCHICSKVINRSYFKEHVTIHDPDHKKYVCDVCGKSFRLRCAYHNHSLRHRKDFPYKCTFCPYRGRYAELLKTHMRTHTGDYRYMCTECPARFLFKSNLNSHMLKHKEPQFKCDTCKRAFHSTLALQRHYEADHLGIKNHVCNICGKAFGYRNAMMKHQRHVHKREKLLFGRMPSYLEEQKKNNEVN